MADELSPDEIARRTFEVTRRGFDQELVRAFQHEVSALVERLQREQREQRERAERAEARLEGAAQRDEAVLLEVLGEETTRVLTSAREAAAEIRDKAEAGAQRLIAEATAQADQTRRDAEETAARLRRSATEEADAARKAATDEAAQRLDDAAAQRDGILATARADAEQQAADAETAATALRAGAEADAQALREEAERTSAQAKEAAESLVETARTEGKVLVAEAQALREQVLRDLAIRRRRARVQVEKLIAGRERLLEAYDLARRTADEATGELADALAAARVAADAAAMQVEGEPEPTMEDLEAEVSAAGFVNLPLGEIDLDAPYDDPDPGPLSGEVPAIDPAGAAAPAAGAADDDVIDVDDRTTSPDDSAPSPAEDPSAPPGAQASAGEEAPAPRRRGRRRTTFEGVDTSDLRVDVGDDEEGVRVLTGTPDIGSAVGTDATAGAEAAGAAEVTDESARPGAAAEAEDAPSPSADDVFAKLRAAGDEGDVEPTGSDDASATSESIAEVTDTLEPDGVDEVPPEAMPFRTRDAALEPVQRELTRRLKRALADEQNEVLDMLRRAKPKGVDELLPAVDAQVARWVEVVSSPLAQAASAGAGAAGGRAGSVSGQAEELARGLVEPLRERVARGFSAADGDLEEVSDRMRALYREWKGLRLATAVAHHAAAAYAQGTYDAAAEGASLRWVVDPATPPCPECDDNVLAGAVTKGEEFPTGQRWAPAHPGCRCLVLPA